MNKTRTSERGQALIFIAIGVVALIGMTALAIDGGNAFFDRRRAQNAADTAAFAGALASAREQEVISAAEGIAAQNLYANSDPNVTVTVTFYEQDEYSALFEETLTYTYVRVDISSVVDTYFAKVLGIDHVTNNVYAIARARQPFYTHIARGNAVVGLAPEECQAVKFQGTGLTTLTGGGVYSNSECPSSAYFNNSSAGLLSTPCLEAVGGVTYATGSLVLTDPACPSPNTGLEQFQLDDFTAPNPESQCAGLTSTVQADGITMSPGYYTSNHAFPPNHVTQLQPGVYCITQADFRIPNGEVHGDGVTFYVLAGGVSWNGGTFDFTSPTEGNLAGWLLILPESNTSAIVINGNVDSTFTGTVFAPRSDINFAGTASSEGINGQIVGWTVELTGGSANSIFYDDSENGEAYIQPAIDLNQ